MNEDFKNILEQIYEFKRKHGVIWFRGHSDSNYKLNSGLYRIDKDTGSIRNMENNIFNAFLNYGDSYCNSFIENKNWNVLFLMQHYGMYTRLLDWTDSFITALYFATQERDKDECACIWMINPIQLNKSCHQLYDKSEDDGFDLIRLLTVDTLPERIKNYTNYFEKELNIGTFAMVPRRNNTRLVSQNGFFTVQGTINKPLDEEYRCHIDDFIIKIELDPSTYEDRVQFLKLNGINYYSLYGGIDGLCKYLKDEFFGIKLNNI